MNLTGIRPYQPPSAKPGRSPWPRSWQRDRNRCSFGCAAATGGARVKTGMHVAPVPPGLGAIPDFENLGAPMAGFGASQ